MKNVLRVVVEFFLFLLLDVIGVFGAGFYPPIRIETELAGAQFAARSFVWDGVILMLAGWLFLILVGAARKRLSISALYSTIALTLATIAGLLLRVGFVTHNW